MSIIKNIVRYRNTSQSVFTIAEIGQLASSYSGDKLYSALKFATKSGDLIRITRGIYSLSEDYSRWELAIRMRIPSYVSFYSVLQAKGVIFQPYTSVFLASMRSEAIEIGGQKYIYRKIRNVALLNRLGIERENGIMVASVERALCDKLYLDGDEHFDNLKNVDWELMRQINEVVYGRNRGITEFIGKHIK